MIYKYAGKNDFLVLCWKKKKNVLKLHCILRENCHFFFLFTSQIEIKLCRNKLTEMLYFMFVAEAQKIVDYSLSLYLSRVLHANAYA